MIATKHIVHLEVPDLDIPEDTESIQVSLVSRDTNGHAPSVTFLAYQFDATDGIYWEGPLDPNDITDLRKVKVALIRKHEASVHQVFNLEQVSLAVAVAPQESDEAEDVMVPGDPDEAVDA